MIRFTDQFLFFTGISFGIISLFTNEPFSPFIFGACLGGLHLNRKEHKNGKF